MFDPARDFASIRPLLDKYQVQYIYIGPLERIYYGDAGVAKFEQAAADGRSRLRTTRTALRSIATSRRLPEASYRSGGTAWPPIGHRLITELPNHHPSNPKHGSRQRDGGLRPLAGTGPATTTSDVEPGYYPLFTPVL